MSLIVQAAVGFERIHTTNMQITFNGEAREIAASVTVADLLAEANLDSKRVAVEVNFELIPRELHASHQLQPADRVEVVTLAGGG